MENLPIELQEMILEKVDSRTLYNLLRSKPNEMITAILERRTKNIIRRLRDVLQQNGKDVNSVVDNHDIDIPDEYKEHMIILKSVLYLPNSHPLVKESIEHLVARYPKPENSEAIDENVLYLLEENGDYYYHDYAGMNSHKAEKYFNNMCDAIEKSGNYITFEQQFYFLCKILVDFKDKYLKIATLRFWPQIEDLNSDLFGILETACTLLNNSFNNIISDMFCALMDVLFAHSS